jgi:hypothetical protein
VSKSGTAGYDVKRIPACESRQQHKAWGGASLAPPQALCLHLLRRLKTETLCELARYIQQQAQWIHEAKRFIIDKMSPEDN